MTMRKHTAIALVALCLFGAAACTSDDGDEGGGNAGNGAGTNGGGTGGAGGTGGTGGTGGGDGELCINVGEDDQTCPDTVGPFSGACAPKAECCRRSSNNAKISMLGPDEPAVLEYRIINSVVQNHPSSTGLPILIDAAKTRAKSCAGEQCLLWRFKQPRSGGDFTAGMGESTIGIGLYNCDGTYSYYSNTAAPVREAEGFTDPARWAGTTAMTSFDPSKENVERQAVPFATNPNRRLSCSVFMLPNSSEIDWELCSMGLEVLDIDTSEAGLDCQGSWDGAEWNMTGKYQVFAPLVDNQKDTIDLIGQSFCQLLSFSVLPQEMKGLSCVDTERCLPEFDPETGGALPFEDRQCPWIKLPDSLCPTTTEDAENWGCHLGALNGGEINHEADYPTELNCTMEAPTGPLDPDMGATSKGQCCDPLGQGTDGLPACNAFRIVNAYAAAAVEITDAPSDTLPPICM